MSTVPPGLILGALRTVRCCREWVVCYLFPWGRCGYCGVRPE